MELIQISLEAARVNAGLTQASVAEHMHVNRSTVRRWEKGISEPTISQGLRLSDIYKMPLDNIFLPIKSN